MGFHKFLKGRIACYVMAHGEVYVMYLVTGLCIRALLLFILKNYDY